MPLSYMHYHPCYCPIHIALPSIHHPIQAAFPSTLPLSAFVHASLPYMILSHASDLSPCIHLIPMPQCHITVSPSCYCLIPMLPSPPHAIILHQCTHFITKLLSNPYTTMLSPHCVIHSNTIPQQKHSNRPPALTLIPIYL